MVVGGDRCCAFDGFIYRGRCKNEYSQTLKSPPFGWGVDLEGSGFKVQGCEIPGLGRKARGPYFRGWGLLSMV